MLFPSLVQYMHSYTQGKIYSLPKSIHKTLFLFCCLLFVVCSVQAQESDNANAAPYQKEQSLPDFELRLLDSVTVFNTADIPKGKPTVFILFSPDCDHCAQLAKQIKDTVHAFDGVNLYMVSVPMPLHDIKMFAYINGLVNKPNITVGQDIEFFFGSYFQAATVPFVVVYNRDKQLVSSLTMLKHINELLQELAPLR